MALTSQEVSWGQSGVRRTWNKCSWQLCLCALTVICWRWSMWVLQLYVL